MSNLYLFQAETSSSLPAVYDSLLTPAFPKDELDTLEDLQERMGEGTEVLTLSTEDGPVAVAVGEWDEDSRVMMLSYLAVSPSARSGGFGSRLLSYATNLWKEQYSPCIILAEVEDPRFYSEQSSGQGDPARRLRFYARHAALALTLPYFQPALSKETQRVPHLILTLLHAHPSFLEDSFLSSPPVLSFLETYLLATEGALPTDPQGRALLEAARLPIALGSLDYLLTPLPPPSE